MFIKIIYAASLAAFVLTGAGGCASSSANKDAAANSGAALKTDSSAAENPASAAATATPSDLKGGAPVPAKRENLTVADREKFLRAVGLTEFADSSEQFVAYLDKWSADGGSDRVKNAATTFHNLGGDRYLVEIIIDRGARSDTNVFALYQESGNGRATAKALKFDSYSKNDGKVVKENAAELNGAAEFDAKTKILTVVAAGRGTGGCGSYAKYKFAGDRAETVEARYSECGDDYDTPPEKWEKLTLTASGGAASDAAGNFEHIRSEHAAVLKEYLKTKPDFRPAIVADYDRANPKLVKIRKENQRNHPYYVADDFNGDGREDFAVILKSTTAKNSFSVAVFNGPLNSKNGKPAFAGATDYRFVFQLGDSPDMPPLYIGSYASDDGFMLEASGKGYKVVSLLE